MNKRTHQAHKHAYWPPMQIKFCWHKHSLSRTHTYYINIRKEEKRAFSKSSNKEKRARTKPESFFCRLKWFSGCSRAIIIILLLHHGVSWIYIIINLVIFFLNIHPRHHRSKYYRKLNGFLLFIYFLPFYRVIT